MLFFCFNFAAFRGFIWISRLRGRARNQKTWWECPLLYILGGHADVVSADLRLTLGILIKVIPVFVIRLVFWIKGELYRESKRIVVIGSRNYSLKTDGFFYYRLAIWLTEWQKEFSFLHIRLVFWFFICPRADVFILLRKYLIPANFSWVKCVRFAKTFLELPRFSPFCRTLPKTFRWIPNTSEDIWSFSRNFWRYWKLFWLIQKSKGT